MSGNVMSVVRTCTSMNTAGSSSRLASLCIDQAGAEWGRTATKFYLKGRRPKRRMTAFSTGYEICFSYNTFPFGFCLCVRSNAGRKRTGSGRNGRGRFRSTGYVQSAHCHLPTAKTDRSDYEEGTRRVPCLRGRDE